MERSINEKYSFRKTYHEKHSIFSRKSDFTSYWCIFTIFGYILDSSTISFTGSSSSIILSPLNPPLLNAIISSPDTFGSCAIGSLDKL